MPTQPPQRFRRTVVKERRPQNEPVDMFFNCAVCARPKRTGAGIGEYPASWTRLDSEHIIRVSGCHSDKDHSLNPTYDNALRPEETVLMVYIYTQATLRR